jgi:hypothetical protein
MRKWKERIFFSRKWLIVNEQVAYKETINCTNVVELKYIGKYQYKINLR